LRTNRRGKFLRTPSGRPEASRSSLARTRSGSSPCWAGSSLWSDRCKCPRSCGSRNLGPRFRPRPRGHRRSDCRSRSLPSESRTRPDRSRSRRDNSRGRSGCSRHRRGCRCGRRILLRRRNPRLSGTRRSRSFLARSEGSARPRFCNRYRPCTAPWARCSDRRRRRLADVPRACPGPPSSVRGTRPPDSATAASFPSPCGPRLRCQGLPRSDRGRR
jgi:hypothetical protein